MPCNLLISLTWFSCSSPHLQLISSLVALYLYLSPVTCSFARLSCVFLPSYPAFVHFRLPHYPCVLTVCLDLGLRIPCLSLVGFVCCVDWSPGSDPACLPLVGLVCYIDWPPGFDPVFGTQSKVTSATRCLLSCFWVPTCLCLKTLQYNLANMNPADMEALQKELIAQASAIRQHSERLTSITGGLQEMSDRHNRGMISIQEQLQRHYQTKESFLYHPPAPRLVILRMHACLLQSVTPVPLTLVGHSSSSVPSPSIYSHPHSHGEVPGGIHRLAAHR